MEAQPARRCRPRRKGQRIHPIGKEHEAWRRRTLERHKTRK